jgi:hypothetical protein
VTLLILFLFLRKKIKDSAHITIIAAGKITSPGRLIRSCDLIMKIRSVRSVTTLKKHVMI